MARNSLQYVILWLKPSVWNVHGYCTNTDNEIKHKRVKNSLLGFFTLNIKIKGNRKYIHII